MGTLAEYSYRRHALYKTYSARDADDKDLCVCKNALSKLNKTDKKYINEMVNELGDEVSGMGSDSALRLLGAVGRYLAKNPAYVQARVAGKVIPNGS